MVEKGSLIGQPVNYAMSLESVHSDRFDELEKKLPACVSALQRYPPTTILAFWSSISGGLGLVSLVASKKCNIPSDFFFPLLSAVLFGELLWVARNFIFWRFFGASRRFVFFECIRSFIMILKIFVIAACVTERAIISNFCISTKSKVQKTSVKYFPWFSNQMSMVWARIKKNIFNLCILIISRVRKVIDTTIKYGPVSPVKFTVMWSFFSAFTAFFVFKYSHFRLEKLHHSEKQQINDKDRSEPPRDLTCRSLVYVARLLYGCTCSSIVTLVFWAIARPDREGFITYFIGTHIYTLVTG